MKELVLTLGLTLFAMSLNAQVEIHVYGGGNLADRFKVTGGDARVFGSAAFGGSVWYETYSGIGVEVEYFRQSTTAEVISSQLIDYDIPMNLNYILGGAHWSFTPSDQLRFNLGLKGGVTGFNPGTDRYNDVWKFTAAGNAGAKYYISSHFGIRAQFHLIMPMHFGSGVFWGGNGGTGVGVNTFTTITQLGAILGLFYAF